MKKKILFILAIVLSGAFFYMKSSRESGVELLRKKHSEFLKNHPFKNIEKLSKKERFAMGIPPNNYLERMQTRKGNCVSFFKRKAGYIILTPIMNLKSSRWE